MRRPPCREYLARINLAWERTPRHGLERRGGSVNIVKDGQEIRTVDQWFALAPPKGGRDQWVEGRSALECARAWCATQGPVVPAELLTLLASHPDTKGAVIRSITPEQRVRFDALRGEPRNSDVVALADHPAGLLAVSIEAKADEPFDLPVQEVLAHLVRTIASDERTNGVARIQQLARSLLPAPTPTTSSLGTLRYQLLTALAGAVAFAIENQASRAILVVHEFVTEQTDHEKHRGNTRDLNAFVTRLTAGAIRSIDPGALVGPIKIPGRPLFEHAPVVYIGKAVRTIHRA